MFSERNKRHRLCPFGFFANGQRHRSLGQRPRTGWRSCIFGQRPYSNSRRGLVVYCRWQTLAVTFRVLGRCRRCPRLCCLWPLANLMGSMNSTPQQAPPLSRSLPPQRRHSSLQKGQFPDCVHTHRNSPNSSKTNKLPRQLKNLKALLFVHLKKTFLRLTTPASIPIFLRPAFNAGLTRSLEVNKPPAN